MSISIVVEQMIMIFILIAMGCILHRKELLSEQTSKQLSGIILNVTNPALLICSSLEGTEKISLQSLGLSALFFAGVYAVLIGLSYILPAIMRLPARERYPYRMMTIFGNVGFIGIPLVASLVGSQGLIYVSINNLFFNLIAYTYASFIIKKEAAYQCDSSKEDFEKFSVKKLFNIGTISAIITIVLYIADLPVPGVILESLSYAGRCTTFLSMLVLGVAASKMAPKDVFSNMKMYIFLVLRYLLIPVSIVLIAKKVSDDLVFINTVCLMLSVPAANLPLMFCKEYGADDTVLSRGIIFTTLLSIITIPIVTLFL